MSWKSDNSVKRIFNTFKRLKSQIFNQDIEALKQLNDELNYTQKSYVVDNLLFAKLLCYIINQNLHGCSDIKTAISQTNGILKEPLNYHLEVLKTNLNSNTIQNYLLSLGLDFNHLNHGKNNNETILKSNQIEMIEIIKKQYSFESIEKSFYNTANDLLKETENYI